jgi:hypothetical protein
MVMRQSDRFAVLANPTLHPAMTTPGRSSAQGMQVNHMEVLCDAKIHSALKLRYLRDGRVELLELEPTSHYPEQTDGWISSEVLYPAGSFGFAVIARRRTSSSDGELPALS